MRLHHAALGAGAAAVAATAAAFTLWSSSPDPAWASVSQISPQCCGAPPILQADASFVVPHIRAGCGAGAWVAPWVGLGQGPKWAQLGVTATPSGVGSWYETFGAGGREVDVPFPVKPGDTVQLAIAGSTAGVTMRWTDGTRTLVRTAPGTSYDGSIAEWVVEKVPGHALADFGALVMSGSYRDRSGWHPLASGNVEPTSIRSSGITRAVTGRPSGSKVPFTWKHC